MKTFSGKLLIAALLSLPFLCSSASATPSIGTVEYLENRFVDYGSYTYDTETGLDWLDWSLTTGMTLDEALANNPGWMPVLSGGGNITQDIMSPFFYGASYTGYVLGEAILNTNSYGAWYEDSLALMLELFGQTGAGNGNKFVYAQGICSTCGLFGAKTNNTGYVGVIAYNGYRPSSDLYKYNGDIAHFHVGNALVRQHVEVPVPAPSALLFMVIGLATVFLRSRKK